MNLSVKDVASLLSVSEKTIYRWLKQELLPVYKVRGSYRFNRAELLEWATSRRLEMKADAFSEPGEEEQPLPTLSEALESGGVYYRVEGKSREAAIASMVAHLRLPEEVDRSYLEEVLLAREKLAPTAIGRGVAIPHPRSPGLLSLSRPTVTLCFLEQPVDFQALDGQPVKLLLPIIAPTLRSHLHLLARLGFVLQDRKFLAVLQSEASRETIFSELAKTEAKIRQPAT